MKPLFCSEGIQEASLICRLAIEAPVTAGDEMMYMPGGLQKIVPSQDGEPVVVEVMVTKESADALEAQRQAIVANGRRPYFDFNHEDREASFWPEQFFWKSGAAAGVYAKGEWSTKGKTEVEGKSWRQFSPIFFVDDIAAKPASVVCRDYAGPNMGGLVNNPAFHKISPFWAKNAGGAQSITKQQPINMTPAELAALQAKINNLESQISALKAKDQNADGVAAQLKVAEAELRAAQAEHEAGKLKAANAEFEKQIKEGREATATAAIEEAVNRGAIAAKDEETKNKWKTILVADPSAAALLAKVAGNPALVASALTQGAQIQRGDARPAEVLKALGALAAKQKGAATLEQKSQLAKAVLALYAKDVVGKAEVLDMPLRAADNTDGNLGILTGTLVALRTIEDYEQQLIAPQFITTDYSDQPAQFGQTTTTRVVIAAAVEDYDATLNANGYPIGWVISTPAQTVDAPITLNNHKGVPIVFDANTLASTVRNLFGEQANLAGYALAKAVNDALLGVITPTNFPGVAESGNQPSTQPVVIALADFGRGAFADASAGFGPLGVPIPGRFCLMNSIYYGRLTQDPTMVSLAVFQKPEIITGAELPPISKFQPLEAPNLPTANNLAAFFGHKSSLVVQTRLPDDYTKVLPGASFGNVSVITGKTGLSMLLAQYVNHDGGYAASRQAIMFGVGKGNAKGGRVVKSA